MITKAETKMKTIHTNRKNLGEFIYLKLLQVISYNLLKNTYIFNA